MTRELQQNLSNAERLKKKRPIHVSWHIAGLSTGLVAGTALAILPSLRFATAPIWVLVAFLVAGLSFSRRSRSFAIMALCAGLAIGLWHGGREQAALARYETYYGKQVTLVGVINEDVSHGDKGDIRMQLRDIRINGQRFHGKVWASTVPSSKQDVRRSDTIQLRGKLQEGFGSLAASMSSATPSGLTRTSDNDKALLARDWFAGGIREAIPEPAASLGSGFLTGQHSDLPGDLSDELKIVGLTHAVVASGSNLTILVGFTRRLFGKASKYVATMGGTLMTFGFVMVTGFSPSMTRAGLVTGLSLAAWYYGRRIHPLVLLPFAAAITVAANPGFVWGDIGWYLSFSAFAGVLILAPLIQDYFWGKDYKPNLFMEILIGTTAAQIATMPVILFSFGTYSSYALLANMLVLPLIPIAMALTFAAGVAGVAVSASISQVIGLPAGLVMDYMLKVIHWVASLPGAQGEVGFSQLALVISYATLIFAILYMWRRTAHRFGKETSILIGERP